MRPTNGLYVVVYYVLKVFLAIVHPTTVEGLEKLPRRGALLCPTTPVTGTPCSSPCACR